MVTAERKEQLAALLRLHSAICATLRWPGSGEFSAPNGLRLLFSGKQADQRREGGVGILLSKNAYQALMQWKAYSDRIISARFRTRARNTTIIQCYAPTDTAQIEQKEEFYNSLAKVFQDVKRGDIIILLGDFNAQLGDNNNGVEKTMGRHGIGNMTENGELFKNFCLNHNLVIGGTLFPHKRIHKVTWVSPDGMTENQIDHIAISKNWRGSLLDVRNKRGADIFTDHHLLTATIRLKVAAIKKGSRGQKRFDTAKLENPTTKSDFTNAIRDAFNNHSTNDTWTHTKNILIKASEEHIGYKTMTKKPWITDKTWNLIRMRSEAKNATNSAKTRNAKTLAQREHARLDKMVKKSARSDKRNWSNQIALTAQAAADTHRSRDLYKSVRQLTRSSTATSKPLRSSNGELTSIKEEQIKIWETYYKELLTAPTHPLENICNCSQHEEALHFDTSCPNIPEIAQAISSLKSHKSPGPDNISPELLKADSSLSAELLQPFVSNFWSRSLTDGSQGRNYYFAPEERRPISMQELEGNHIIKHGQQSNITYPEQAVIRLFEQSVEWRSPLYLCFIDFAKAFDTIRHEALLKALECKRVPKKIIRLIASLYDGATCRIRHEQQLSDQITVEIGVRQGCVLSPLLFNILLDVIMSRVTQSHRGITWGLQGNLCDLDYADDICLIAHKGTEIQVMRINASNNDTIAVNRKPIENVNTFCYLGSIITSEGGSSEDIKNRLNKGRAAFASLEKVWRSTYISRNTKIKIFNASIKSVILYGCETWNSANKELQAIQVFINRCLRKIVRIFWPNTITNEELWRTTKQESVLLEIRRRKWMWIGHTLRKPHDDITRTALDWNPQGSRRRGRPANTWRRLVDAEIHDAGYTWRELKNLANDRTKWNAFVTALCSS
ncbi:uncharacterized protein LOC142231022 [Haematobia irritans]|uniref:uncharacterized protein LOC142231022 n=1 Tax=Haematobia irritans TaxID=7368 RepID=UPI003F4F67A8